jgi:prolyl 3-hydroxylase /prolyl 3,4-dihydroxylase
VDILHTLQDTLFSSSAFRAWLAAISSLAPMRHAVEARRFRPGLDYTLATSEPSEARLDVVLGLTPQPPSESTNGETSNGTGHGWEQGQWGGWECYMAPHDEEDDPAVYRSGPSKNKNGAENGKHAANGADDEEVDEDEDEDEEMDDEDGEGTLLTSQPGFNRLLLVLRDEGVMRFVKYVSAAADSSRWDICGEYEVGMVQEESSGSESD